MKEKQPLRLRYSLLINDELTELKTAPTGWENTAVKWARSSKYFGLIRSLSVPMEFVLEGAFLLRREFYTRGLAGKATLFIDELDKRTWTYRPLFVGALDFSEFKDGLHTVSVPAMEEGISEKIKAYENIVYEIPFDEDALTVKVPGIGLIEDGLNIFGPLQRYFYPINYFDGGLLHILATELIINRLENEAITLRSQDRQSGVSQSDQGGNNLATLDNWLLKANEETTVRIAGRLKGGFTLRNTSQVAFIQVRNNSNQIISELGRFIGASVLNNSIPFDITFDFSYELQPEERLFIISGASGSIGSLNSWIDIEEGDFRVTNALTTADTFARAYRPFDLFRKLIAKMNGGVPVECRSFLLDKWKNLTVTSGDAIRQIPDAVIKTSFNDFFKSLDGVLSVGFMIEKGVPVIEEKRYFVKKDLRAADIGEVKAFRLELATDLVFNSLKIGYNDNDYDVEYGREEVNSTQIYSLPITRVQKEADLISPYRADQFGIESVRTIPVIDNETEKDNKSDNDTFFIKISDRLIDGAYEVEGAEAYRPVDGIRGVSERNSYYNLDLTPKKNLLRNGALIRSVLHNFEGRPVRMESAEKNRKLITVDLNGVRVAEEDVVLPLFLDEPLFLPYVVTVTGKMPANTLDIITNFPTGFIRFSYRGYVMEGFILEAGVDIARNSERDWKLLLSPSNNLRNIIH